MRRTFLLLTLSALLLSAPTALAKGRKPPKPEQEVEFGIKMAKRGLWAEALFRFRQAEKRGDTRGLLYNNIAVAYEALGVFEKAEEYYRKALDVDANNAALRRNYSRFVEFYQSYRPDGEEESLAEGEPAAESGAGTS